MSMLRNAPDAGIIALDQVAAFPRISRKYIIWVLQRMGVPKRIIRVINKLYEAGCNGISMGGRVYIHFYATSGVKQGCPASMVLFTLAFDLIL